MRKQIINGHTIKVFITRDDLKRNGITALDLLGDHNQIENFFYKILDKVDTNHLFMPHEPLTFRVLPNQKGLDIIITRHQQPRSLNHTLKQNKVKPRFRTLNNAVIQLNNFEDFVQISRLLKINHGDSKLFEYHRNYYLELKFDRNIAPTITGKIKNLLSIAYEYGKPSEISANDLQKKGKMIMSHHALEQGRYYFH